MAKKKKRLRNFFIALPFAAAFIVFANLCDTGFLPSFLQKPVDNVNFATGSVIYKVPDSKSGLSVHFIDVGQGDSILVSCEGKNMLIDGGVPDEGPTVENYLKKQGVSKLDYVVGTHPHEDHIGGLVDVLRDFNSGTILMSGAQSNTRIFENLLNVISQKKKTIDKAVPGRIYILGGAKITVLAPLGNYDDLNNWSVVLKLNYKKISFLFTGDASKESEEDMLSKNYNLSADVLKVGHHGSSTATTQEFLKAVHPRFAVISVGLGNSYGLPDKSVTQRLKDAGIKTFRTDVNGTVDFYSNGNNLSYEEEKK